MDEMNTVAAALQEMTISPLPPSYSEWLVMHKHQTEYRKEKHITIKQFLTDVLHMSEKEYFVSLLSAYGQCRNPSVKPGTTGRKLRDALQGFMLNPPDILQPNEPDITERLQYFNYDHYFDALFDNKIDGIYLRDRDTLVVHCFDDREISVLSMCDIIRPFDEQSATDVESASTKVHVLRKTKMSLLRSPLALSSADQTLEQDRYISNFLCARCYS
jgi:hypothetical protein